MQKAVVSLIVPCHNVSAYIDSCLESVVCQSFKDFEAIIVDDGSIDDTLDKCQEWAKRDGRIRIISQKNKGVSSARNLGIKESTGDFICFLDGDDTITPRYISSMLQAIQQSGSDLAICGLNEFSDKNGKRVIQMGQYVFTRDNFKAFFGELLKSPLLGPVCKLFKRSIIIENRIEFPLGVQKAEDFIFYLQYLSACNSLVSVPEANYNYYLRSGSLVNTIPSYESAKKGYEILKHVQESTLSNLGLNDDDGKIIIDTKMHLFLDLLNSISSLSRRSERLACYKDLDTDFFLSEFAPISFRNRLLKLFFQLRLFFFYDLYKQVR